MRDARFCNTLAWVRQRDTTAEDLKRARVAAREIAVGPAAYERIIQAWEEFRHEPSSWWNIFHTELVDAMREDPTRQQAWADTLEEDVAAWNRALPTAFNQSTVERGFQTAAEDWQSEKDPFSIWGHPSAYMGGRFEDQLEEALLKVNLLLQIHPTRGLRLCDMLPFPGIMEGVFYWGHDVRRDRELIETLLIAAPIAFDGEGAWKPERS